MLVWFLFFLCSIDKFSPFYSHCSFSLAEYYRHCDNALQSLDVELKELHVARQPVPNVWIIEVGCLNPLNEASNIIHYLSS